MSIIPNFFTDGEKFAKIMQGEEGKCEYFLDF